MKPSLKDRGNAHLKRLFGPLFTHIGTWLLVSLSLIIELIPWIVGGLFIWLACDLTIQL